MKVTRHYLLAVAAIIGCASGGSTSESRPLPGVSRNNSLLTFDEIAEAHADINTAYDAVARLRPNWLAAHGSTSLTPGTEYAVVFLDGQQYGALTALRNIPAYQVAEFRYYDVTQAGAKYGLRAGASGVIDVRLKGTPSGA